MSESNVKKEFASFGKKALILAIIPLCSFFFNLESAVLLGGAIFLLLGNEALFLVLVIQIIFAIFLILVAIDMGKAGKILNNQKLFSFRYKIIVAAILTLSGTILFVVTIYRIVPFRASAAIIGLFLPLIGGGIFQILGWNDLKGFFKANMGMFPEDLGKKATSGSRIMKIGSIFYLTFILTWIGYILWIIGYFKLSNLRKLA